VRVSCAAATFALGAAACTPAAAPPNEPTEVVAVAPSAPAAHPPEISTATTTVVPERPSPTPDATCTMGGGSTEDRAAARDLFKQGVEAYARGDYDAALDRFRRADALVHAPTIAINIARCLHALGRDRDAVDVLTPLAACSTDSSSPAAFQSAIEEARRMLNELRSRP
jgi:hypothetical protein